MRTNTAARDNTPHQAPVGIRVAGGLAALLCSAFLALALTGCSGGSPDVSHSTPKEGMRSGDRSAKISDQELERIRFREIWSYKHGAAIEQLWFLGDNLYMTTRSSAGNAKLLKINGANGLVEWTYDLVDRLEFEPTVYEYPDEIREGRFRELFLVQNDNLYCLDDEVGLEVYVIKTGVSVSTPIEVSDRNVFVGTWDHRIYGFGKSSRIEEWTYLTDGPVVTKPTVGRLNVYVGSEDGSLYCLNSGAGYQDGDSWIHRTGGKIIAETLFYKDRVYTGSWDYKVYCLAEFRGLENWTYPCGAPVVGKLFPFRDTVYATLREDRDPKKVWTATVALHQETGAPKWERKGLARVVSVDAIHCFAMSEKGSMLHAVRQTDGQTDWEVDMSRFAFVLGQDAHQGAERELWGRMVVATRDGVIQCVQPRR